MKPPPTRLKVQSSISGMVRATLAENRCRDALKQPRCLRKNGENQLVARGKGARSTQRDVTIPTTIRMRKMVPKPKATLFFLMKSIGYSSKIQKMRQQKSQKKQSFTSEEYGVQNDPCKVQRRTRYFRFPIG